MKYPKQLAVALTTGTVLFTLAACGDGDTGDGHTGDDARAEQTAANGDVFNDADVEFATAMIPHHTQALAMVDIARSRALSPQVRQLTMDIEAAQAPEIDAMRGWLADWDVEDPEGSGGSGGSDGSGMDGHDMDDMDDTSDMGDMDGDRTDSEMPGMMTDQQLADLEDARGTAFEDLWLEMMIEHHEGAIEMAEEEQEDGVFRPALDLAEAIETSQQAEIDLMRELLAS